MTLGLSLRETIEALPPEEAKTWRSFYSDKDWNSWEVNARPFQLPPDEYDWGVWTVIGGRGVGKTEAGLRWAISKAERGAKVLCLTYRHLDIRDIAERARNILSSRFPEDSWRIEHSKNTNTGVVISVPRQGISLILETEHFIKRGGISADFVWADNSTDSSDIIHKVHSVQQYVFTGPVALHPTTVVTRAGDESAKNYDATIPTPQWSGSPGGFVP